GTEGHVDAPDQAVEIDRRVAALAAVRRRVGARARRPLRELEREVERGEHGDALARLHLAAVADRAHLAIDVGDRLEQRALAAVGTAEDVALAEDRDLDLLHPMLLTVAPLLAAATSTGAPSTPSPAAGSRGKRCSSTSILLFAALRRERRLSRSPVTAASCAAMSAFVRCSSSCRRSSRSTRSASSSIVAMIPAGGEEANCRRRRACESAA